MIEYRRYCYNIIEAKVSDGPRGSIFSVWKRDGNVLKMVHQETQQFPSETDAEVAARAWIDHHTVDNAVRLRSV